MLFIGEKLNLSIYAKCQTAKLKSVQMLQKLTSLRLLRLSSSSWMSNVVIFLLISVWTNEKSRWNNDVCFRTVRPDDMVWNISARTDRLNSRLILERSGMIWYHDHERKKERQQKNKMEWEKIVILPATSWITNIWCTCVCVCVCVCTMCMGIGIYLWICQDVINFSDIDQVIQWESMP